METLCYITIEILYTHPRRYGIDYLHFTCHSTNIIIEVFSCFSDSPAEKRPVVSLMEDDAKPSVSVLNIFKQVKCNIKTNE